VPVTSKEASVTARLLSGRGAVLRSLEVRRARQDAPAEIDLPLSSIARGDYLIMMEAAQASERVDTFLALRVVR
jgi:hypothetical protein